MWIMSCLYNYLDYYYQDYYDGSRYMISKYGGKYWLDDEKAAFTIEKDGQSLKWDKRYIYSYGKSGFVIVDKKENTLKVMFDAQSNDFQKQSFENRKKRCPQYIRIVDYDNLTIVEKNIYTDLRNSKGSYNW